MGAVELGSGGPAPRGAAKPVGVVGAHQPGAEQPVRPAAGNQARATARGPSALARGSASMWSARVTIPRTGEGPSRSSHATRYSPPGPWRRARASSRDVTRSVSTDSTGPGSGLSLIEADTITPVSPMPPMVARRRSGSLSGVSSRSSPSARQQHDSSTCAPKVPTAA